MLPVNFTQSGLPSNLVLTFLKNEDVLLMDTEGKPLAVLVSPERYEKMKEGK